MLTGKRRTITDSAFGIAMWCKIRQTNLTVEKKGIFSNDESVSPKLA